MKVKNTLLIISFLFTATLHSQSISDKLPELIPPSPTVAALMKYEEIPVSNYTGVPNISIPIYSYNFPSNKIGINIGLSYHSGSTKLDELASDIGLGWSLSSSGSISRSVRGMPDELYEVNKYGIYKSNIANGINYYQTVQTLQSTGFNPIAPHSIVDDNTNDNVKEFLFETNAFGKYDTQHDLWQYNFNGRSGRFYIEKQTNGTLEVKLLENDNLKIINHYNENSNIFEQYKPIGFTVYDELGHKYIFDVIEKTTSNQLTESNSPNNISNMSPPSIEEYTSAFHLSKIYDNNNNLLVEYTYINAGEEHIRNNSLTYNHSTTEPPFMNNTGNIAEEVNFVIENFSLFSQDFLLGLYKPKSILNISNNVYLAKKISEIKITGVGKVNFEYQTGREDDDYINRNSVKILKKIKVKELNDTIVKSFELEHEYKYAIKYKLFLKGVTQTFENDTIDVYKLFYKEPINAYYPAKDNWGYFKNDEMSFGLTKTADRDYVTSFVLEKMVLPTGGCVVFNYESNTYAYQGNEQLTNFDSNFYNWDFINTGATLFGTNSNTEQLFTINVAQDVYFQANTSLPVNEWYFSIYKDAYDPSNPTLNNIGGVSSYSTFDSNGFCSLSNVQPGTYVVRFSTPENPYGNWSSNSSGITAYYRNLKTVDYKNYFYGGGFRISKISTFNDNINTQATNNIPQTIKEYYYNDFENNLPSSGVLVSKEPLFKYETILTRPYMNFNQQGGAGGGHFFSKTFFYTTTTNYDKINRGKTQGAEIGYKNVTVKNTKRNLNNGRTEYTYSTSLEHPNIEYTFEQLFLPPINLDYKRGLLKKEEVFDQSNKRIISRINNYEFSDTTVMTGLHLFGTWDEGYNNCPSFKLFTNYNQYKDLKDNSCIPAALPCSIDYVNNIFKSDMNIGFTGYLETYGWAKLTSTNTKEYFYPSGSATANIVETNQTYTYNPINKQIAESTTTNSNGEILKTNYYYHTGNSTYSQNRISEIERVETYRNGQLLSTSKINYTNNWGTNVSFLPQTIQSSKGTNALETKVKYNKYDAFNNPLEVQQENGTKISYIWGYNNTQPVAKLENIAYDAIPSSLITAIQSATDAPNATESSILTALNALRTSTDTNMQKAMITTYTYKPLIGISTVTDPKTDKITYHYDSFNRLEFVKDKNGNILSENEYHYRTQN